MSPRLACAGAPADRVLIRTRYGSHPFSRCACRAALVSAAGGRWSAVRGPDQPASPLPKRFDRRPIRGGLNETGCSDGECRYGGCPVTAQRRRSGCAAASPLSSVHRTLLMPPCPGRGGPIADPCSVAEAAIETLLILNRE